MKKIVAFITLALLVMFVFVVREAKADNSQYGPYGQYGGNPPTQNLLVDKMVGKPSATTKGGVTEYEYVDNLSPSDPRFSPNQQVYFRIRVKNTGNSKLYNVVLRDTLPSYINPVIGPGSFDANTRIITINVGDMDAGAEQFFYLVGQVFTMDNLPSDKGLFCLVNRAEVTGNNVASDDDTSQFCIEKQVTGATKVPQAGAGTVLLIGQLMLLGAGYVIKKRAS